MIDITIYDHLSALQRALTCDKDRAGGHKNSTYRNVEDILKQVKPLLSEGCCILMHDSLCTIQEKVFIKSTASFLYKGETICADGYAQLPVSETNRSLQQTTGATSTYSRRYALMGLLAVSETDEKLEIDDGPEIDSPEDHRHMRANQKAAAMISEAQVKQLSDLIVKLNYDESKLLSRYNNAQTLLDLTSIQYEHAYKGLSSLINIEDSKV